MTVPLWIFIPMIPLSILGLVAVCIILSTIVDVAKNPQYDR